MLPHGVIVASSDGLASTSAGVFNAADIGPSSVGLAVPTAVK